MYGSSNSNINCNADIHNYYCYYHHYNDHFFRWTWVNQFLPGFSSTPSGRELLVECGGLQTRSPSCHPTISVKSLKGTQSTNCNQWPGLMLSSSTNILVAQVALPVLQHWYLNGHTEYVWTCWPCSMALTRRLVTLMTSSNVTNDVWRDASWTSNSTALL